jgi:uncharacterized delta-60 repeat protein
MTTNTTNTVTISEIPVDPIDPTKAAWGPLLKDQYYFAIANGTAAAETFDAHDLGSATQTRMATYQRGVYVNMGAGDDTIIGSDYGDNFVAGDGTNYIDGGANVGTDPNGMKARDVLNVFAGSQAAADALSVTAISASATGADATAFASGYTIKVSNGTEIDYLKGVEQINVFITSGTGYTYARTVRLALDVWEVASANAAASMDEAYAQGTDFNDTFNAATDVSAATQALMSANGRGVWVDTGAGDDTVTGSGFGDDITVGSGTNYVDGGANAGSPPWGGPAVDVLHVTVANQAAADAVRVVQLAAGMSGADATAFTNGYAYKVVANGETDYVKGIERVSVQIATTNGGSTWARDIALAVVVREADLASTNNYHMAYVTGTANGDTIDASAGSPLLSDAVKAAMAAQSRGVWIDGGDGNDTITGTAFADNFRNGAGNSHIDGGANAGPNGQKAMDVFEITVATTAEMAAVKVSASDDPAYTWMVTYGTGSTQKDYLKNIEAIAVNVTGGAGKWIPLAVSVNEIAATGDLANSLDYAWVQGTSLDDTFNATTDVTAATRTLMDQHQRGVWVDLGAGNDTITGSAYGDDINAGSGTNYVDGGANAGSPPWGGKALDTLHVVVADQAAAAAVQVVQLTAASTGADAVAFGRGFVFKVIAGTEIDYVQGIERVSIQVDTGNGGSTWARDIPLAVVVQEANLADPKIGQYYHLAWVNGTANADTIDASAASPLLSDAVKAAMATNKHGVWIDGGAGGDTITGTAYADNIRNGAGNDKVDGGANISADGRGQDVFEITVADTTAMAAVTLAASDDPAYTWMVTYGAGSTQKDYLKNIEGVIVSVNGGTASKWIPLAISIYESTHPATDQVAFVQGTAGADVFSAATDLSATALAAADANKHGVYVDLGAGDDTATGTAYGDDFNMGTGTNYVDGGTNTGTAPWGGRATDGLHVVVSTQAEIDAVQVTALTASMTGVEKAAFDNGYTQKVVAAGQVDYIKGIEHVYVSATAAGTSFRDIALEVTVREVALTDANIGNYHNLAFITGTDGSDTIDANALLSDAIKTEMATRQRGVWIDGGAGNDVITGTGFGDNFRNGAGNSKIDGGANAAPAGQNGLDVFEISVGSAAELSAIRVVASDDPAYQWMVTYGGTSTQKDYLKNIEAVSINVTGTSTGKWVPLAISVTEVDPASSQLNNTMYYASVAGTSMGDSFDAATGISAATQTLMTQHTRGIYVDLGAGNDTITGSAYGDNFVGGAGTNYIDGGTNLGTQPGGAPARDVIEVFVPDQAAADAVTVTKLTAAMSGADGAAYAAGYRVKIVAGTAEVDYVRNVETLNISIWNDKNGDGNRDYRLATDAANEVTLVRSVTLGDAPNSAPTFGGAPAGVAISDAGIDYGSYGGIVLASGKLLALSYLTTAADGTSMYVNRTNADGSVDTSFGGGTGRVLVPTWYATVTTPVELADGKILVGTSTGGTNADFKIIRLNADGSVDSTFGTNGSAVVPVGTNNDLLRRIAVDANGKIVIAGQVDSATGKDMAVVRLNANGSLDTTFNGTGKMTVAVASGTNQVSALALTADGKVLVGGFAPGTGSPMALVRVNADGTLDSTFGSSGVLTVIGGAGPSQVTAIQVLASGKILVGGNARTSTVAGADNDPVLMRLNADGSPDTSFGTNGVVKSHPTDANDNLTSMLVQPDGKIVTLGAVNVSSQSLNGLVAVTRYNADGSLDTAFGNGGSTRVSVHGIGEQVNSLALVNGKLVVFGSTINDLNYDTSNMLLRLNADGSLDSSFGATNPSSLGGVTSEEGYIVVPLDMNAAVYDAELALRGNYGGASLTLVRHGGASANDVFSALGDVSFNGGVLKVGGVAIGSAVQAGGTLSITFNTGATQALVNRALHGIGYANAANPASSTVTIDWTFSDGNDGSQGPGGVQSVTGSTIVKTGILVNEAQLASQGYGQVTGTVGGDVFDSATGFTATARSQMDSLKHGANFDMGAGDDTVTGTAYADSFVMGSGTNRVIGGGNASLTSGRYDALNVYAADSTAAAAVQISALDATATGADKDALLAGYTVKVVSGSETDYLKNVQEVDIWTWNDANGNKVRDPGETAYVRTVGIGMRVFETPVSATDPTKDAGGNLLSSLYNLANANGWQLDDSFNANTDISAATRARMDLYQRGVFVDAGAGNDTIVGSAYGDNVIAGAGVNRIDGGANAGTDPNGNVARDYLQVYTSGAAGDVKAIKLTATMTGDDGAAYAAGYAWKVTAPGETDYVKNVEEVTVYTWNDANQNGVRDSGEVQYGQRILLAPRFDEVAISKTDATKDTSGNLLSTYQFMAWGNGTSADDVIDATSGLSVATQGAMTTFGRGVSIDAGAGNDTLVGSAYGDEFISGAGINKIDGRANLGTDTGGNPARDVLQLYVADAAAAAAVTVTELAPTNTGADGTAYSEGYRYKVVNGTVSTDYVKGVEQVNISIWNDKDGDGQRDYAASTDPVNEVTFVRSVTLNGNTDPNTAPTFSGAPAGVAISDAGLDHGALGGTVLASGQMLALSWLTPAGGETVLVLNRTNADGSVDTSFGGGTGRVTLPTSFNNGVAPVELANGQLLVAVTTYGNTSDFKVMRLNADGSVDTNFGSGGSVVVSFGSGADQVRKMVVDPSGNIVVLGNTATATGADMAIVRLTASGALDAGFNGNGKLTVHLADGGNSANAVAFDGAKMVIVGSAPGTVQQAAVVRLNADGSFDTTFGTGGKLTLAGGPGATVGTAVQVLAGGKILLGAQARTSTAADADNDPVLVRLNADGTLDQTFGSAGMVQSHPTNGGDLLTSMLVQPDGKIVTMGNWGLNPSSLNGQAAITRYNADGSLDTAFGIGGTTKVSVHGIGEQAGSLALVGGKLVVFGSTVNDTDFDTSNMIIRLNADGTLDSSFGAANPSSLGGIVSADGYHAVALDLNVSVYDAQLAARGSYGGAAMTLARHGGASADDVFSGVGEVSLKNGAVMVGTVAVGTFTQANGTLNIVFNSSATQGLVNRAMHGIGYSNAANLASGSVTIDWTFSDGNTDGSQGFGGVQSATGSTTVQIKPIVSEIVRSLADPALDAFHGVLANRTYLGTVTGTAGADTFDGANFSTAARGLMDEFKKGAFFDMGPGDDTVTGTGYADLFTVGSGTNFVSGGGNATVGRYDALNVYAADSAAAANVQVLALDATATGADKTAFDNGFKVKVVNGTEIDYLKSMQEVDIWTWNDANGNNVRDSGETAFVRGTPLNLRVYETQVSATDPTKDANGNLLSSLFNLANANGWSLDDNFNATTSISAATLARMDQYKRGVYVDLGAGNDTIVGSSYGDTLIGGAGVNKIDGGTNLGTDPNGNAARDVLNVYSTGTGTDVVALQLTAGMSNPDDAAAFAAGYTWKITAPGEVDYVKNVEEVNAWKWNDANKNGVRDGGEVSYGQRILLAPRFDDVSVSATDPTKDTGGNVIATNYTWVGWGYGTQVDDVIDANTGMSVKGLALMNQLGRGVQIDGGAGNDTLTGSAYGDLLIGGTGVNRIDGGANGGTDNNGHPGRDIVQVFAADPATVSVTPLTAGLSGADAAAYADGYTWKVSAAGETDYLKGIEALDVMKWTDANSNGLRDNGEVSYARSVQLVPRFDEISVSASDPTKDAGGNLLSNQYFMAWGNGTALGDVIDATSAQITTGTHALMDLYKRGVWIDGGAGNDTITGSAYGDSFTGGTGINRIDGGDNMAPSGQTAADTLDVYVADQAAADAVAVVELNATMTSDDGAAYAAGYKYKVTNGTAETDYIKNVEQLNISIWNDKNHDGQRDYLNATDPANEVTFVRNVMVGAPPPVANKAPVFGLAPGMVSMDGGYDFAPAGLTPLASGKFLSLVLMNQVSQGQNYTSVLVRNNADGSVDTSFGNNGRVFLPTYFGQTTAPVEQADGKILWAVSNAISATADFKVVRFNADGSVDTTFGTNGEVVVSLSAGADVPRALLLQGTKIVVAGNVDSNGTDPNFGAIRLNADGSLDNTFNGSGKLMIPVTAGIDRVSAAVQAGDKLVITGYAAGAVDRDFAIVRVNADGTLDTSFNTTGKLVLPVGAGIDTALAVKALADGSLIVVGDSGDSTGANVDVSIVKIKADGTLDTSFGNAGKTMVQVPTNDHAIALQVQADGKIVVAGNGGNQVAVVRLNANGTFDTSFGPNANGGLTMAAEGISDRAVGLSLVGDKIVLQIGSAYDKVHTDGSQPESLVLARLNSDGSLDATFGAGQPGNLGGVVKSDGVRGVALDFNASIFDAELAARNDYNGAALVLSVHGGASDDDAVFGIGDVSLLNDMLTVGGTRIGNLTWGTDSLTIRFEAGATQALVNRAIHGIGYANSNPIPPASVTLDWSFSDGNTGSQGTGGAMTAVGSTTVEIGVVTTETVRSYTDSTKSADGRLLSDIFYLGTVYGTRGGDTVDATALSTSVRGLMDQYKHGASFVTRGGGDTVSGTNYGDNFTVGKGVNYVDGGANINGSDVLTVYTASQAEADGVQVVQLVTGMSGADADAYTKGYVYKIVRGAGVEVDYIKNVERISIYAVDSNNVTTYHRDYYLTMTVTDADPTLNPYHLAYVYGSDNADVINLSGDTPLLSAAVKTAMASGNHGVYVNGRAGNDTIIGTAHADNFANGPGNSHIDGGDNVGPNAGSVDVFEVTVATAAQADAVKIEASDDPAYTWMVTYGAGSTEKDYLKNVEAVTVGVAGSGVAPKWIPIAVNVFDNTATPASQYNFAYVTGTALGDTFNANTDLSSSIRAVMDQYQRGAYFDMKEGNDTIVGTAYYDDFNAGPGVNYVDGGGNAGSPPSGGTRGDVLNVITSSNAQSDAVQVTKLVSGLTGADGDAFTKGYTYKVSTDGETDYIKNIEVVQVQVHDTAANTTTWTRTIALEVSVNPYDLSQDGSSGWMQVGEIQGTINADVIDASATSTLLPASLKTEMANSQRGLNISGGEGGDTITGSAYADFIHNGAGNDHIDGGTNLSLQGKQNDVFVIDAASAAARDAIKVELSDDSAYQWMVTYGTGSTQKDYLKNIEGVSINAQDGSGGRYIQTAMTVGEIQSSDPNLDATLSYAYVNGTALAESFDPDASLSAAVKTLMTTHQRGIYVDMGAGNDTVIGTAYGDQFILGTGTNYVDGLGQAGTYPGSSAAAEDVLQVFVGSVAEAQAVTSVLLTNAMSGTDLAAFNAGYTYKITAGAEIDYVKNVEKFEIRIWTDLNHDGNKNYTSDATNEVTVYATHPLDGSTVVGVVGLPLF